MMKKDDWIIQKNFCSAAFKIYEIDGEVLSLSDDDNLFTKWPINWFLKIGPVLEHIYEKAGKKAGKT